MDSKKQTAHGQTQEKSNSDKPSTKNKSQEKSTKVGETTRTDSKAKTGSTSGRQQKARFHEKNEGKLKEFFIEEIKDIYFAEHEALKALTKMEDAATSAALKKSISQHYAETEAQIKRLEEVFALLGEKPAKKKCEGILGIIKDGESVLEDTDSETMVRDAAIIIANQKVEHYEITSYGSLAELARTLGLEDVAELFDITLDEEKNTDVTLTTLAVESVNEEATKE